MTDFSVDPEVVLAANLDLGYVGLHFQQGVPLLDRDLNLVQDLAAATVRRILAEYVGSGVAPTTAPDGTIAKDAFQIRAVTNPNGNDDFVISAGAGMAGRALVNGLEATITADVAYSAQLPPPDPLRSPSTGTRTDVVYLDVFLTTDESGTVMDNPDDIVVQTSVRLRPSWAVRVAMGGAVPDAELGHGHLPLAQLVRTAGQEHITPSAIVDRRPLLFSVTDLRRILLDPVILTSTPSGRSNDTITISGKKFQLSPDDPVTVLFDTTPAVNPTVTPTKITVNVPAFPAPLTQPVTLPLTVQTAYGFAQTTFRALPG